MQGTRWVFTINNPSAEDHERLLRIGGDLDRSGVSYLVYGREVGESGTPHLQGYCIFASRRRLAGVRSAISERGHFEISRGTPLQASDYCKKGGDFTEHGTLPTKKRAAGVPEFCEWLKSLTAFPSEREIANAYPGLWVRYQSKLIDLAVHIVPPVVLEQGDPRPWQQNLEAQLNLPADDRSVLFYVDAEGGTGKSYFCRYMYTKYHDVQLLSVAKRDDLSFAIDITKRIFLFNIPRGGMEFLQYTILEQIKDRVVFSPKYYSQTKVIRSKTHVVVFCNEDPDREKMSFDRYKVVNLRNI